MFCFAGPQNLYDRAARHPASIIRYVRRNVFAMPPDDEIGALSDDLSNAARNRQQKRQCHQHDEDGISRKGGVSSETR